jgi:peptidyl-prolyl cis-trans isomerase C
MPMFAPRPVLRRALAMAGALALPWAATAQDDPVIATVNGAVLHRSQLEAAKSNLPAEYRQMPIELLYDPLLDQVVNGQLLLEQAAATKVEDDPLFEEQLAKVRQQLAREFVLRAEVERAVTPEDLQRRYDDYVAANPPEEEVRASHILVATEDEAKAVKAELDAGADFAELAKTRSTDPSVAQNGGDLGFFRKSDMVPEFSDAAFALDVGETSGPVKTAFGWHIVRVAERRQSQPPAFADVEEQLRGQAAAEAIQTYIATLRANAVIERFNIDGTPRIEPVAE